MPKTKTYWEGEPATKKEADGIAECIFQGMSEKEIGKELNMVLGRYRGLVCKAIFCHLDVLSAEDIIIRDAVFRYLLGEHLLKEALDAAVRAANPTPKTSRKATILHALSPTDLGAVRNMGAVEYLNHIDEGGLILKEESSEESAPAPSTNLLEKLLQMVDDRIDSGVVVKKLIEFSKTDPRLPSVG